MNPTKIFQVMAVALLLAVTYASNSGLNAQECTTEDINGEERDCTHWEEFMECRDNAQDAYLQCRAKGRGYFRCDIPRGISMVACDIQFLTAFVID